MQLVLNLIMSVALAHTGLPTNDETGKTTSNSNLMLKWLTFRFGKRIINFIVSEHPECKETDSNNSVQSSLNSNLLCVTRVYNIILRVTCLLLNAIHEQ